MQALRVGEHLTLNFTTVVDELTRGLVDEDEDAEAAPADRAYWERKATPETVSLADDLLGIAKAFDPELELKFTKFYIGLSRHRQVYNFVTFRPRKNHLLLGLRLPETEELTRRIEATGIETQPYERREGAYRLRLSKRDFAGHADELKSLLELAHRHKAN